VAPWCFSLGLVIAGRCSSTRASGEPCPAGVGPRWHRKHEDMQARFPAGRSPGSRPFCAIAARLLKKSSNRRVSLRISTLRVPGIVTSTLTAAPPPRSRDTLIVGSSLRTSKGSYDRPSSTQWPDCELRQLKNELIPRKPDRGGGWMA
jgi:hypothetical protein